MYGLSPSDAVLFDDMPDMRVDQYPVLRRFYRQTPARNTRFRTKFYDALREATETRRGMRQLDRALRPDLAGELENKPANAHHDQLVRANKSMQSMRREMDLVRRTDSLDELKQYALALKADESLKKRIGKIQMSGAWKDIGALKRQLMDLWVEEQNSLAKRVVQDIEK